VGRYIEEAKGKGIASDTAVTEEVTRAVGVEVQTRPQPAPSAQWSTLERHRTEISTWLTSERPLRLVRIHELLERDGVSVGYTTLRRFAHRELGWRREEPTVRLDDPPAGQEAQLDFGLMGKITDEDGVVRKLYALIVTLVVSRFMFVWPTLKQTTEEVCAGLDAAWKFFGGVTKHAILDNATAMVLRASATDPRLNRSFRDYAEARRLFIDTTRVRHPKDKARVENQVPYVRERWFAGETFSPRLVEIRRHAELWCREVAGARVHGTTRKVPRDVYEADERAHMQPAPASPYDVPLWCAVKVHPDHHVQVQKALYSVPTRFIGKMLDARADRSLVRFYLGTEIVKVHSRKQPGERSTDPSDYPPGKAAWALRDVDAVVSAARVRGQNVGEVAARLLGGSVPWLKLRQAYRLLSLCDRYGNDRVNALCARAIAFDVVDVPRIEGMLKDARRAEDEAVSRGRVIPMPARFARDARAFATRPSPAAAHSGEEGGE